MPKPTPRPAPVTRATRPARSAGIYHLRALHDPTFGQRSLGCHAGDDVLQALPRLRDRAAPVTGLDLVGEQVVGHVEAEVLVRPRAVRPLAVDRELGPILAAPRIHHVATGAVGVAAHLA